MAGTLDNQVTFDPLLAADGSNYLLYRLRSSLSFLLGAEHRYLHIPLMGFNLELGLALWTCCRVARATIICPKVIAAVPAKTMKFTDHRIPPEETGRLWKTGIHLEPVAPFRLPVCREAA